MKKEEQIQALQTVLQNVSGFQIPMELAEMAAQNVTIPLKMVIAQLQKDLMEEKKNEEINSNLIASGSELDASDSVTNGHAIQSSTAS